MFHLANTYIPTICLIFIVMMTLFTDDHYDTNVMVRLIGFQGLSKKYLLFTSFHLNSEIIRPFKRMQ